MDELQRPQPNWGAEIRNYEHQKRHVVDEGLLRGPQIRVTNGQMKRAERVFDPLLQRYRQGGTELQQRKLEETERVAHLNRAQDIQILREQPFDIIRHESKLEALVPGADPVRLCSNPRRPEGNPGSCNPDTTLDYNLISNLPLDVHHWARPDQRPLCVERPLLRQRSVPAYDVKDFNVVTNRYHKNHQANSKRDHHAILLEATHKDATVNCFNPVTQQYQDPRHEERARACDDVHGVELHMRADAQLPPSFKGRETSFFNMVNHQKHDDGMLQLYDEAQESRKDRYRNRYIMEHNWHVQDIKGNHINNVRKLNRNAPERLEEETRRGHDIVTNHTYGHGPKAQAIYTPFSQPRPTPWEQATSGSRSHGRDDRMSSTMPIPGRFGGIDGSRSDTGRSRRSHSAHGDARSSAYAGRAG